MSSGFPIGIVIPVNNRYAILCDLISSISSQNYPVIDILIVDNASTDGLKEAVFAPNIEILPLSQNYGAAHGFIEGVQHLLRRNKYKYLWLLDSDLIVANDSLSQLVDIMEADSSIGVCGSIIYNIHDRDIIVESGAKIDLARGLVISLYGNKPRINLPDIIDVDYVGSGVSLLRTHMVEKIGLYDERYHFLWEDMDYGLHVRQNGWRVVVSTKSEVYHPPFTEKRNPNIYAYYGVRNPLLTVAKYANGLRLPWYLYGNLCRCLRIGLLMVMSGCKGFAGLTFKAIFDFVSGRFGKADLVEIKQSLPCGAEPDLTLEKRIYIIGTGSREASEAVVSELRATTSAEIVLVVQSYRQTLLEDIGADSIITYDDHSSRAAREYLKVGMTILRQSGCIINTDLKVASPLSYFSRRVYDWDFSKVRLHRSPLDIFSIWKPAASVIFGNLLALVFLPPVWIASLKHKMKHQVLP